MCVAGEGSREVPTTSPVKTCQDISTQCSMDPPGLSAWKYRLHPDRIHFYTGLQSYEKFIFVLNTLGPARFELNYYNGVKPILTIEDQFFLTLIKLRQHSTHYELAMWFEVNESVVSNVFITWINFMYMQWSEVQWWPHWYNHSAPHWLWKYHLL